MARTVAEVLATVRTLTNDADAAARSDSQLIGYVRDALYLIKNVRPDLFLGQFRTAMATLTTASSLPIDDQFFSPIYDYVVARAEMTDDESANSGRAELSMKLTQGFLL